MSVPKLVNKASFFRLHMPFLKKSASAGFYWPTTHLPNYSWPVFSRFCTFGPNFIFFNCIVLFTHLIIFALNVCSLVFKQSNMSLQTHNNNSNNANSNNCFILGAMHALTIFCSRGDTYIGHYWTMRRFLIFLSNIFL